MESPLFFFSPSDLCLHRISGAPDHNSLRRTKEALDGLLSQNPENKDDGLEDLSADEEGGAVEGGGTALEPDGQASGEATPANLVREAAIVDAKQMVNKEKARAELDKSSQIHHKFSLTPKFHNTFPM